MFSSITKLKLGYQDPGRNLNRTALDITVRSRDPSLFYPPATSPEAAHAAVAIQKFHSQNEKNQKKIPHHRNKGPTSGLIFAAGEFPPLHDLILCTCPSVNLDRGNSRHEDSRLRAGRYTSAHCVRQVALRARRLSIRYIVSLNRQGPRPPKGGLDCIVL